MHMWDETKKIAKEITKPYEDFQKAVVKESSFFLLGVVLEGSKGLGWRGALFIWPFLVAFGIILYLLTRVFFAS